MIKQEEFTKQLQRIKKDPSCIAYLITLLTGNWGQDVTFNLDIIRQAMEIITPNDNIKAYTELALLQANYYFIRGEYSKLIEEMSQAYDLNQSEEQDEKESLVLINHMLMNAYLKKGNLEKAIEHALEGIQTADNLGKPDLKMKLLLSTIRLYMGIQSYRKAEKLLKTIDSIQYILKDTMSIDIEILWSEIYLSQNEVEQAAQHNKLAYELAIKNKEQYRVELIHIISLRAQIDIVRNLDVQAERDLEQTLELAQQMGYEEMIYKAQLSNIAYKYKQGNLEEAEEKALELAKKIEQGENYFLKQELYHLLNQIYEVRENWKQAYYSLKRYDKNREAFIGRETFKHLCKLNEIDMVKEINKYKLLYHHMHTIAQIGAMLTKHLDLRNFKNQFYQEVGKLFKVDFICIHLAYDNWNTYDIFNGQGSLDEKNTQLIKNTDYLGQYCMENQTDIIVDNGDFEAYSVKQEDDQNLKIQSLIYTSITLGNKVIGAVGMGCYEVSAYNYNDLNSFRVIASYLAITLQNAKLYGQVEYFATHDSLTGLLSRGKVLSEGEALFKVNHKKHRNTGVMMLDTDFFKQINDRYGHLFGDEVLKTVGKILRCSIRKQDFTGRYGGEEFLVILDHVSEEEVINIIKNIRQSLQETSFNTKKENNIKVTISGGFYICNEYTLHFRDALSFADHALYRAKLVGRNRIVNYNSGKA